MNDLKEIIEALLTIVVKACIGVAIVAIPVGLYFTLFYTPSDDYSSYPNNSPSGSNVNFKQSYQSKYGGNPCGYKEYSGGLTCSEKQDCYGGFSSSNRDASICGNCGHSYSYHK